MNRLGLREYGRGNVMKGKYIWIFGGILVVAAVFSVQKMQIGQYIETTITENREAQSTESTPKETAGTPKCDVDGQKHVYLTFDDGPSELTEKYLDILKNHQIHATFFVIGKQVEQHPEIIKREIDEGHEVGVHTYSHESGKIYQSADSYYQDACQVRDILKDKFGLMPKFWRFPWGSVNCYICSFKKDIITRLQAERLDYVDWNVSAEDSVGYPSVSSILQNIRKNCFQAEEPVVLMHDSDSNQPTLDSLEAVIELFEEQGYQFETMSRREKTCHFGEY